MATQKYSSKAQEIVFQGGKINCLVMDQLVKAAVPGVTTGELDSLAEKLIKENGASPSFKMEKGYYHSTCLNVNEVVVHGIPDTYKLKMGDILGIDLGIYFRGYHTDASRSFIVGGEKDTQKEEFLAAGKLALKLAIGKCRVGNRIGDISRQIQTIVEGAGYSVVKQLVGHGVGRHLHEDPEIPGYQRGSIARTEEIVEGMVLAIEVIYNRGLSPIVYANSDGWTIISRDLSWSGLFEDTVVVTNDGPLIATS